MLVLSKSTRQLLEQAVTAYERQMTDEVLRYFEEDRGITRETLQAFRVGFVGDPQHGHEMYRGRIAFPYLSKTGVTTIRFRRFGNETDKKILSIQGHETRIYNPLDLIDGKVVVCEGEMDTLTASQCGYLAVGIPGAKAWKRGMTPCFRYREVSVVAHNDDNGEGLAFAKKIASDIEGCKILLCPPGHDLNSLYVTKGRDAVKEFLGE